MATPTLSHAVVLDRIGDADSPNDPNVFTLGEIATVLTDSATTSSVTSQIVSTAASGALDSVPVSTADSKAVSSASRASVADSKAISVSSNASVADSKALSVSVNTSVADSKGVSNAGAIDARMQLRFYEVLSWEVGAIATEYPWYHLKRYGAAFDNLTDDSAAWANAVASVPTGGAKIIVPWGVSRLGATVELPVDRRLQFVGEGQGVIDGATPVFEGSVIRRASGFTDAMFTQTGTASPIAYRGVCFSDLSFAGDFQGGDCLQLEFLNFCQFENVTWHQIAGHSVRARGLLNSWFHGCRWYRCGDATHEVVVLDATTVDVVGSQGVYFIDPIFENSKGTDLLLTNAQNTGTVGTSNIHVIGGKIEQSNTSGVPGLPMVKIVATQNSAIRTAFQNGAAHGATQLQIGETGNTDSVVRRLIVDSNFAVFSSTDADNPQYLVDVQDGGGSNALSSVTIKGTFHRGAGNGGAQIRVAPFRSSGFGRVTIDPSNVYTSPLSGVCISGVPSGPNAMSADRGDATQTIVWGLDAPEQRFATDLSADRTLHVALTSEAGQAIPAHGAKFRIIRTGLGVGTLNILNGFAGTSITRIPPNTPATVDIQFDGTNWVLASYARHRPSAVSVDNGDAAATLIWNRDELTQRWNTPLTTNRNCALSTTDAVQGAKFHVVRTTASTGVSSLNVGTGPLKALAAGQWCDVEYDGSAWLLTAFGSL